MSEIFARREQERKQNDQRTEADIAGVLYAHCDSDLANQTYVYATSTVPHTTVRRAHHAVALNRATTTPTFVLKAGLAHPEGSITCLETAAYFSCFMPLYLYIETYLLHI